MTIAKWMTTGRVLVIVFLIGLVLRIGYGVAVHRHELNATGNDFISLWDYDAIEHVTIAKAIMEGKGYIVDPSVDFTGKHPRVVGEPAVFKAPLYQYLLAAIFSISGFSFALFFPIQALLGAALSAVVAAIAIQAFNRPEVGLLAGLAAAAHPTLLNTASQPYNENLFFFLFFLVVWMFLRWMAAPTILSAVVIGVIAGLNTLTRESAILPFLALALFAIIYKWREDGSRTIAGAAVMVGAAALTIAPWTIHNYRKFGVILPVSSITGTSIGIGNNECVATGGWFVPYDGDIGCPSFDQRRTAVLNELPAYPSSIWNDRAYGIVGREYIAQHPVDYIRMSFRRAWTTFMPIHPRQGLTGMKALMVLGYFILVVAVGLIVAIVSSVKGLTRDAKALVWITLASYIPLVVIYVSADGRYRVGIDLLLGCFAAYGYALLISRIRNVLIQRDARSLSLGSQTSTPLAEG